MSTTCTRRGFTLLEVTLAVMLGTMVILGTMALFAALERSQKRHEMRMQLALETQVAHKTMMRAFSSLLMGEGQEPGENEVEKLRDNDRARAEGEAENLYDASSVQARFALQPADVSTGGLIIGDRPAQTLLVALRVPPIAGEGEREDGLSDDLVIDSSGRVLTREEAEALKSSRKKLGGLAGVAERRARRVSARSSASAVTTGSSSAGGSSDPGTLVTDTVRVDVSDTEGGRASGSGGKRSDGESAGRSPTGSVGESAIPGLENVTDPARAPGVRGVFEILPDDPKTPVGGAIVSAPEGRIEEVGVALYWRPLGTIETTAGNRPGDQEAINAQEAALRQAQVAGLGSRRIKLLGGLRSAGWQVLRGTREYRKMSAKWASELPAHVEFSFETLAGTREDWMFEVAWATGPEPGAPVASGNATTAPYLSGIPIQPTGSGQKGGSGNGKGDGK